MCGNAVTFRDPIEGKRCRLALNFTFISDTVWYFFVCTFECTRKKVAEEEDSIKY